MEWGAAHGAPLRSTVEWPLGAPLPALLVDQLRQGEPSPGRLGAVRTDGSAG